MIRPSPAVLAGLAVLPALVLGTLPGVLTAPDAAAVVGAVVALSVATVTVAAVVMTVAEPAARAVTVGIGGRQAREQARRGAFRRQSAPTTDGRPRPRAPGRA